MEANTNRESEEKKERTKLNGSAKDETVILVAETECTFEMYIYNYEQWLISESNAE